jgi:hypothetical protein
VNKYAIEQSSGRLVFRLTLAGRWVLGVQTGLLAAGVTLLGLAVFYLPDYLADYSKRGFDFTVFFGQYLLFVAGLVGIVAGVMRGLGDYSWTLDRTDGVVRWWSRTAFSRIVADELDLERVVGAEVVRASGWWPRRELLVRLDDGELAVVAFGSSNLDEMCAKIASLLDNG